MSNIPAPKPAIELFPESLTLSQKQRYVLNALSDFPEGIQVTELAEHLNMHINTVRGHLDRLVERGAIQTISAPAQGRGRPSLIYKARVPDNRAIAKEYISLIEVLASQLDELSSDPEATRALAHKVGAKWGAMMKDQGLSAADVNDAIERLGLHLREMGFDPEIEESTNTGTDIVMNSCPFIAADHHPSPFLCAVHQGMLSEFVGSDGPVDLTLIPFSNPGQCTITVTKKSQEED